MEATNMSKISDNFNETTPVDNQQPPHAHDSGFELPADDPRRTDNRGGLENIINHGEDAFEAGQASLNERDTSGAGNTGVLEGDAPGGVGAGGSGAGSPGQIQPHTNIHAPKTGPIGAGEVEGGRSGATEPQVEMTDIGLVDVGVTDMSVTGDDENRPSGGARVEGPDGQPL
jgi:hypothetical protein